MIRELSSRVTWQYCPVTERSGGNAARHGDRGAGHAAGTVGRRTSALRPYVSEAAK